MSIFLTADLHFGHHAIIGYGRRPWADREAMHEGLVELWNETVKPTDTVFILGDFTFEAQVGSKRERIVQEGRVGFARRLNGIKYLIPGNHDRFHPQVFHRDWEEWLAMYRKAGIEPKQNSILLTVNDPQPWQVVLNHFPYQGTSRDTRYEALKLTREETHDLPLIHGHVHTEWRQNGNMVNVGADAWEWKPVPLETVIDLLRPYRKV